LLTEAGAINVVSSCLVNGDDTGADADDNLNDELTLSADKTATYGDGLHHQLVEDMSHADDMGMLFPLVFIVFQFSHYMHTGTCGYVL